MDTPKKIDRVAIHLKTKKEIIQEIEDGLHQNVEQV